MGSSYEFLNHAVQMYNASKSHLKKNYEIFTTYPLTIKTQG